MSNIWEELGNIEPDIINPRDVIGEIFKPIRDVTKNKVSFRIQKVNYFPEEVVFKPLTFSFQQENKTVFSNIRDIKTELPHPDFGYDPESTNVNESFRYRFLLLPGKDIEFEFELFKFKFPLYFYPVNFYIEKTDFPELADYFTSTNGIDVQNESDLRRIIEAIIKSSSTLKLIRRIMAL